MLKQEYEKYTTEDHKVWSILFNRQMDVLSNRASTEFLEGLEKLGFEADRIPNFDEVNIKLKDLTGWKLKAVPGIVPNKDFFEMLDQKMFPATTWIRKMSQLDYLEEPDMFHDLFGHVPLLSNQNYVDFLQGLSKIALKGINNDFDVEMITRIYWYTIEFGLIKESDQLKIYGSGILSSSGESVYSLGQKPPKYLFNISEIFHTPYIKEKFQDKYFVIDSYEQLYNGIDDMSNLLKIENELIKTYEYAIS